MIKALFICSDLNISQGRGGRGDPNPKLLGYFLCLSLKVINIFGGTFRLFKSSLVLSVNIGWGGWGVFVHFVQIWADFFFWKVPLSPPLHPLPLRRQHSVFNHKIEYVALAKGLLILKGYYVAMSISVSRQTAACALVADRQTAVCALVADRPPKCTPVKWSP